MFSLPRYKQLLGPCQNDQPIPLQHRAPGSTLAGTLSLRECGRKAQFFSSGAFSSAVRRCSRCEVGQLRPTSACCGCTDTYLRRRACHARRDQQHSSTGRRPALPPSQRRPRDCSGDRHDREISRHPEGGDLRGSGRANGSRACPDAQVRRIVRVRGTGC